MKERKEERREKKEEILLHSTTLPGAKDTLQEHTERRNINNHSK